MRCWYTACPGTCHTTTCTDHMNEAQVCRLRFCHLSVVEDAKYSCSVGHEKPILVRELARVCSLYYVVEENAYEHSLPTLCPCCQPSHQSPIILEVCMKKARAITTCNLLYIFLIFLLLHTLQLHIRPDVSTLDTYWESDSNDASFTLSH